MRELNSGNYFGSELKNYYSGGIWTSLAKYDESLLQHRRNYSNDWHFHQNLHFSFFLEGGCLENRKTFSASRLPGQVCFYQAGEPHQNINVLYPSKNFNVEIDNSFLSKYDLTENLINSNSVSTTKLKFAMLKIYKEVTNDTHPGDLALHSLMLSAIAYEKSGSKKYHQLPAWVRKVNEVLNDHWDRSFSLNELSKISGAHPITISKHFPKYFHCTLGEYIRQIRIEKSLNFIKQTNESLTDIAYRCGFADQSHFTRVFKNLTGIQPGSYRKI